MTDSVLRTKSKEFAKDIVFLCRKFKLIGKHAVFIAWDRHKPKVHEVGRADKVGIGEVVDRERVARAEEREENGRERVLHAGEDCGLTGGGRNSEAAEPVGAGGAVARRAVALGVGEEPRGIVASEDFTGGVDDEIGADAREALHRAEIDGFVRAAVAAAGKRRDEGSAPGHAVDERTFAADVVGAGDGGEVDVQPVGEFALRRQAEPRRQRARFDIVRELRRKRKIARPCERLRVGLPAQRM